MSRGCGELLCSQQEDNHVLLWVWACWVVGEDGCGGTCLRTRATGSSAGLTFFRELASPLWLVCGGGEKCVHVCVCAGVRSSQTAATLGILPAIVPLLLPM
jgi:hypothetical protein